MAQLKVAVIRGGISSEREVSLKTGHQVAEALVSLGYHVEEFDITPDLAHSLLSGHFDAVYIALHGKYGEDGCIQGFLEILGLPYVGSGVLASAMGMNKLISRKLFETKGLPVPPYRAITMKEFQGIDGLTLTEGVRTRFGFPLVVKPNAQGSSEGVFIVKTEEDFLPALKEALRYENLALIEKYLPGKEVTVSILGNDFPQVLPVIEIVPRKEFYDYEAKYAPGMSQHLIPADLSPEMTRKVQEISLQAYRILGCRDFARVDFLISEGKPYLLEVNTLPGMTSTSLVPDAAKATGLDFPHLVEKLVLMARERKA